jgi:hypothetical protein
VSEEHWEEEDISGRRRNVGRKRKTREGKTCR